MNYLFSIFNTREIALMFWVLILIIVGLRSKNTSSFLANLFKIFFGTRIFVVVAICWIYLSLVIIGASKIGWWNSSMTKDSVIWMLAVIILLGKVINDKNKRSILEILKEAVQPIIFVEFFINIQTLPLFWEILLLPFLTFLYAGSLFGQREAKYSIVVKFFNFLLSLAGIFLLVYCIRYVIINFNSIDKHHEGLNFFLPLWLTISFVPCLYMIGLYSRYGTVFSRIKNRVAHRGNGIAGYFKRQFILKCGLSMKKLDKFDKKFRGVLIDSKSAVDKFFLTEEEGQIELSQRQLRARVFVILQYLLDNEPFEENRKLKNIISNSLFEESFVLDALHTFSQSGYIEKYYSSKEETYLLTPTGRNMIRLRKLGVLSVIRFLTAMAR